MNRPHSNLGIGAVRVSGTRACFLAALSALIASSPESANACGPCTDPALLSIESAGSEPVVVSNFGLLDHDENGWHLTCEEQIGGLILDVAFDGRRAVVSSDSGLFVQDGDLCGWAAGPASVTNEWFVSFATASSPDRESGTPFGLLVDADTQELVVERGEGDQLAPVGRFDGSIGYREIAAGGAPAGVFVGGYSFDPRVWNLAYSTNDGDDWAQVSDVVGDDYSTAHLSLVDPERPEGVFIELMTTVGQPDELWRFDATSGEAELMLILEDGELLSGITLGTDALWVAGSRRSGGSIYKADRQDLVFTRVSESAPITNCLAEVDGELYVCVNDFTVSSQYIIGVSNDEGLSWSPFLTLGDLGTVDSCGETCTKTDDWLRASYGVSASPDAGTDGPEATESASTDETPTGDERKKSGGCSLVHGRADGAWRALLALLTLAVASWRRRRRGVHSCYTQER